MTKFRHDINALRALAVAAVVLYHYKVTFLPGGYVGVDIFFVISGYLMTDIIIGGLEQAKFNIFRFYNARIKRIVPGLAGLCLVLLVTAYFVVDPVTYNNISYTATSALLFYSNIIFYNSIGYFGQGVDTQWLLHTWSLSIEWQFYLIYPVLLIIVYHIVPARKHLAAIIFITACISFILCVYSFKLDQNASFYLFHKRAWELLAGGIVALCFKQSPQKASSIVFIVGVLLIGVSMFAFNRETPWPYYWAILPVAGTSLVIAANRAPPIFTNSFVQILGKWSYSIYLWHWPIAVAFAYFGFTKTTALLVISKLIILAAIIFSGAFLLKVIQARSLSYRDLLKPAWAGGAAILGLFSLAFACALLVNANRGFADRRPDGAKHWETYKMASADWAFPARCDGRDPNGNLRPCRLGQGQRPGTLIIGDSFAMQLYNRLAEIAKTSPDRSFTFLASSGCPPVTGIEFVNDVLHCNGFFDKVAHFIETEDFARIVLVSSWAYFPPGNSALCFTDGSGCTVETDPERFYHRFDSALAALGARLGKLEKQGVEVVIVSATPWGDVDVPMELQKRQFLGIRTDEIEYVERDKFERMVNPVKDRLKALAASIDAKFVDPLDFLCDGNHCPTIDENRVPYFRDRTHYRSGAVLSARFRSFDDAFGIGNQYSASPASLALGVKSQPGTDRP